MKETLEYYYNLDIDNLEELDGKYHFKIENQDFFFVFYNRGLEELEDIINVCSYIHPTAKHSGRAGTKHLFYFRPLPNVELLWDAAWNPNVSTATRRYQEYIKEKFL